MRRRAIARILQASSRAEARYVRDLRAIMRGFASAHVAFLEAHGALKQDAARWSGGFDALGVHLLTQVPGKVGPAYDRMATEVNRANRKAAALLGITPTDTRVAGAIAVSRDENIRLVEDAGRVYAKSVREIMEDPNTFGLGVEAIKDKLLARGNVSESQAELIARDQTLKLNAQINETRQTNAGVSSYVWSTSGDERVRDEHRALDGQTFTWAAGTPIGYHPGEDYQCRCIAIPVVDEFAGI